MNVIFSIFRLLTVGNPNPKQMMIRVGGIIALVVFIVIWGINYRNNPPAGVTFVNDEPAPAINTGMAEIGGSVTGSLEAGESHEWKFESGAGQHVNIRVLSEWDSHVALNGNGEHAFDLNSGGDWQPLICNYLLRTAGTYSAVVGATTDSSFGDYTLVIEEETYLEERPIAYDETVEGRLSTCDGDFYTIAVEEGDAVEVRLTQEEGADLYLVLGAERNDENPIGYSQPVAGEPYKAARMRALRDGLLFIRVAAAVDGPQEAGYTLSVGRFVEDTATATVEAEATD